MTGKRLDLDAIRQRVDASRAREGLAKGRLLPNIQPGAVFIVPDEKIDFPESDLPGATRSMHRGRRVIVVGNTAFCRPDVPKTVQVVPVTGSFRDAVVPPYYFELPDDERAFDPGRKVALVQIVQPILKSELDEYVGNVSPPTLVSLLRCVAVVFGLTQPVYAQQADPDAAAGQ